MRLNQRAVRINNVGLHKFAIWERNVISRSFLCAESEFASKNVLSRQVLSFKFSKGVQISNWSNFKFVDGYKMKKSVQSRNLLKSYSSEEVFVLIQAKLLAYNIMAFSYIEEVLSEILRKQNVQISNLHIFFIL